MTVQGGDEGNTTTVKETFLEADEQRHERGLEEVVADKGYHSSAMLVDLREIGARSYLSEPRRGRRRWQGKPDEQACIHGNRRRIRGVRGRRLQRRRGELLERTFAHVYDTGGMRRTHLPGQRNILKRLLLHVAAFHLSLVLRREVGVGTPRGLQSLRSLLFSYFWLVWMVLESLWERNGCRKTTSATRFRVLPRLTPELHSA